MQLISKLAKDKYPMADPSVWLKFKYPEQTGIDPIFAGRLAAFARDQGKVLNILSGHRSTEKQIQLFKQHGGYKDKNGNWTGGDGIAAIPGTSWHEFRLAVDVSDDWAKKLEKDAKTSEQKTLLKYGIYKPLTKGNKSSVYEDWHLQSVELIGIPKSERSKYAPEVIITDVKDFQTVFGLTVDGKIGKQTKAKAQEVKELIEYILKDQKPSSPTPTFVYRKELGADIFEIDPLSLKHIWLQGDKSQPPSELVKQYPTFVNAMFFEGQSIFRLFVEDGKIISDIKNYDQFDKKGTFIVYNDGSCEVKTIGRNNLNTLDLPKIKMAIQGFNMDYEANGSANLKESMRNEGFGQSNDYIYNLVCNRPGIGYNPEKKKVIIAILNTDASGLRKFMRSLGCKLNGNSCCLGLDSGASTACAVDGKILYNTTRKLVSILTF